MKLTYEKINQLARLLTTALTDLDEVEIYEEPNTIRQEIIKILNDLMREEEEIDNRVRQQITSQKKTIPEGSAEWDILYIQHLQRRDRGGYGSFHDSSHAMGILKNKAGGWINPCGAAPAVDLRYPVLAGYWEAECLWFQRAGGAPV